MNLYTQFGPEAINHVSSSNTKSPPYLFATRNKNKLAEYQRILKSGVDGIDLKVPEIQDGDPLRVLEAKAKAAYQIYGKPIFVEDTSLTLPTLDNMIGPFADNETNTSTKLAAVCRMFAPSQKRDAVVQVGIAIFDGIGVFSWIGKVDGVIAEEPVGANGFGFDPIFIPNGSKKTFAQMTAKEKDIY